VVSYGLLTGAVVLTLISQPWRIDWDVLGDTLSVGTRSAPALVLLAWVVLVSTVLAYLTGISAIRRLSAQVAAAVACLEVVIAAALAWIALGEALSALQILGGAVVLGGAFIAQTAAVTSAPSPQLTEPKPEPATT
jgi:drug/metabolite transporter (DMT)-like permease